MLRSRNFKIGLASVILALSSAAAATTAFDPARYLDHIKFLASPEMKGRATGSPELEKAARYISDRFKADGLVPAPGAGGFLQPFQVTSSAKLGKGSRFEVLAGADGQELQLEKEFIPLNFSSNGRVSGSAVFVGYGITAPEYGYDDYAGLDVKGKIVIVLAHEPQEFDEKSVFAGKSYTDHSQYYSKASNARAHGAKAVVAVKDRLNHKQDKEDLDAFGKANGPADAGIPIVEVRDDVAQQWFQAAGKDLQQLEAAIDGDLKPRSFEMKGVEIRAYVDLERAVKTVNNVVGYLPGQSDEYVIIGAHYDHLGLGEQFSMAPSMAGTVHPGADDNASGTAGVLELAHYFAAKYRGAKPRRGILFMTFAGEELGLLGSGFYANHPEMPLARAVTMINLDMIGRPREGKYFVGGAGTGSTLRPLLDAIIPQYQLKIDYSDNGGYGSSDHTSFTTKQVPVLFFFSGLHSDYHKPGDTWDKIDTASAVQVLQLIADLATRLETDAERPQFIRVLPKADPHSGTVSGVSSGSGGGYGPNFGSIPDFSEPPKGVRFADVKDGSPAAAAGLKAGDIMITFGDKDIANLYDFTYALRSHKPGDEVLVEVLRGDQKLAVKVKLTERK
jgi:Zn-dependent M28 family amino/carboxypeptidase